MRKIRIRNMQKTDGEKTSEETKVDIKHPIEKIMETALSRIRNMIDTSIVIGERIQVGEEITIIPISKVSVGFVAGGGEYKQDNADTPFAGGSGAGFSVSPIGFATVSKGKVSLSKIEPNENLEKLIESLPEIARIVSEKIIPQQKQE